MAMHWKPLEAWLISVIIHTQGDQLSTADSFILSSYPVNKPKCWNWNTFYVQVEARDGKRTRFSLMRSLLWHQLQCWLQLPWGRRNSVQPYNTTRGHPRDYKSILCSLLVKNYQAVEVLNPNLPTRLHAPRWTVGAHVKMFSITCHAVRQEVHMRCPQGSIFTSLLFSAHILHSWKVEPISQYNSYCSCKHRERTSFI